MKKFIRIMLLVLLLGAVSIPVMATNLNDLLFRVYIVTGNVKEVKNMIRNKEVNINTTDMKGLTPLHYALSDPNYEIVELLLNAGANINKPTATGTFPLKLAMISANRKIINLIKDKNAKFAGNMDVEINGKKYLLSAAAQEYLTVQRMEDYGQPRSVLIIQEPHYFDDQWHLYKGLELFYQDNPDLIPETIFLAEGATAYREISIDPLFEVEPEPSETMIRSVLDSFLIPGYLAFLWKHPSDIPVMGMEDQQLHDCSARLWYGTENAPETWQLSVTARNRQMAETLMQAFQFYDCPVVFVGGLHLDPIDSKVFQKAKQQEIKDLSLYQLKMLKECENLGISDYLKKEKIGYTFIYAHTFVDKKKQAEREKLYRELFKAQINDDCSGYIKNYYKKYGSTKNNSVTVRPSVENAAQLVAFLKNSPDQKEKQPGNDSGNKEKSQANNGNNGGNKGNGNNGGNNFNDEDNYNSNNNWFGGLRDFWEKIKDLIKNKIPLEWGKERPNKKKIGFRWQDPKDKGNGVRIDQGDPNNNSPSQQKDHVQVVSRGKVIGRDGKPIKGSIKEDPENAHIPLEEWLNWKNWNSPN